MRRIAARSPKGHGRGNVCVARANGEFHVLAMRPVVAGGDSRSIGAETTFARDVADGAELRRQLDALVHKVGRRLRAEGLRAHTINLKARYEDFTTVTRAVSLPAATAATRVLREAARELLEKKLGRGQRPLRLVGVSVSNLERADEGQGDLFGEINEEKDERLDHVLDAIDLKFGPGSIRRGR